MYIGITSLGVFYSHVDWLIIFGANKGFGLLYGEALANVANGFGNVFARTAFGRRRLMAVWYHVLVLLVLELILFIITGYMANMYQNAVWEQFNKGAAKWQQADKVPYADVINRCARQAGLNAQLVAAVIKAESSFQPRALSPSGAYGLMQIIPDTWQQINKEFNICSGRHAGECTPACYYDAELNICVGTAYLSKLYRRYNNNMVLALAAYNAGPGAVDKYHGIPPYEETRQYVERIVQYWYEFSNTPEPGFHKDYAAWDKARTIIGWVLAATILVQGLIGWQLFRYYRSWRWG